jgi:hypothetical protein
MDVCVNVLPNTKLLVKGCDRSALWQVIAEIQDDVGSQLGKLKIFKMSRDQKNMAHELAQDAIRSRSCLCFFLFVFQSGLFPSFGRMLPSSAKNNAIRNSTDEGA